MKINVTQSSMPDFEEYCDIIKDIWDNKHLTNNGPIHAELEKRLNEYLKVYNTSLATNGHLALELALSVLNIKGEVITTPYTFISTAQAIKRSGLTPVFCDINEDDFTIDVSKIESLITEKTCAILPVHVYGNICDVESIEEIATKYNLKVIYDAAHAFGVEYNNTGIGNFGDISMFSFHATKVFNTIEGGALTFSSDEYYEKLKSLKNFGIIDVDTIGYVAGNAKMDEFRSAMGILNLKHIDSNISKREIVYKRYIKNLEGVEGISVIKYRDGLKPNYAYFPITIDEKTFGENRDTLFNRLKDKDINSRKYFYPCINTTKPFYDEMFESSTPVAYNVSKKVLCLPMYADLRIEDVDKICEVIKSGEDYN
ncbi:MAG: DegT/DnrJ/EryC1/StrS family aminotransferase [Lagierella massiliensis]|nr:DegT/DnrJ/EryC1/StrS family aminotransferase [Lagierella massiliensis]